MIAANLDQMVSVISSGESREWYDNRVFSDIIDVRIDRQRSSSALLNSFTEVDLSFQGSDALTEEQNLSGQSTRQTQEGSKSNSPRNAAMTPIVRLGNKVARGPAPKQN